MPLYFDNAAAAPCSPEALTCLAEYARQFPGNQESMGFHGSAAARRIREAGEELTAAFGFSGVSPVFGNTGTEVLAIAVETACRAISHSKGEVITTTLEHPALEYALKRSCSRYGLRLHQCPADRSGVRLDVLESMLSGNVGLVAVHHVQSETGGILNLTAVRSLLDRLAPQAILLADTMQSLGKIAFDFSAVRPDFMVLSGQKLGAPGGAVLFCADRYGKAARALRSAEHFGGRCSVPVLLTAVRCGIEAAKSRSENSAHALLLRQQLLTEFRKHELNFPLSLPEERVSPFIVHLLTTPYQGAILTRALHLYRISVAPGSACESETPGGSRVLSAMGYSRRECFCGLRISFWTENTLEEVCCLAEKLACCVQKY